MVIKISEEIQQKVIKDYLSGLYTTTVIAEKNQIKRRMIYSILKEKKIPTCKCNRLSESDKLKMCKYYLDDSSKTWEETAKVFNIDIRTLAYCFKQYEVEAHDRLLPLNEDFFKSLTEKDPIYLAGILGSDGHLAKYIYNVVLSLQLRDKSIIDYFKFITGSGHKIVEYEQFNPTTNKMSLMCRIAINRKNFYNCLVDHGITNAKSKDLRIPKTIPRKKLFYFLRGYSDGNGSFYISRGHSLVWRLVSPCYEFLEEIQILLEEECGIPKNKIKDHRPDSKCYSITYDGNIVVFKIVDYIYQCDPYPRMDRKFEKCQNFIKDYNIHMTEKAKRKIDKVNFDHDSEELNDRDTDEIFNKFKCDSNYNPLTTSFMDLLNENE